ncbi:transcription factor WhiB [Streptomyces cinnamoneus]|uniref:Transcriptional regulator WhiB n=1 Tax=Streptomyces cinnamoneus TaxID=53446 RepID=A0A2G1XNS9_STRCJ|nr:WhiB family transcriptional regulator [Streptomyces cinnamoneus]PHQ52870.1 transcription factor WhiB [Streptomyces cinnamoneus]PPT11470.1 WhiB family transcriptional regulator [Streptomyces cinnamoneus]
MNWRQYAACAEEDPDLFFPVGTGGPAIAQTEGAKSVCQRCPVREQCLRWAMESGQEYGVWGGTSELDRRALRLEAKRRAPAAG